MRRCLCQALPGGYREGSWVPGLEASIRVAHRDLNATLTVQSLPPSRAGRQGEETWIVVCGAPLSSLGLGQRRNTLTMFKATEWSGRFPKEWGREGRQDLCITADMEIRYNRMSNLHLKLKQEAEGSAASHVALKMSCLPSPPSGCFHLWQGRWHWSRHLNMEAHLYVFY